MGGVSHAHGAANNECFTLHTRTYVPAAHGTFCAGVAHTNPASHGSGWLKPAPQYDPALHATLTVGLGQCDPAGHMPSSSAWLSLRLLGQYAPSLLHGR